MERNIKLQDISDGKLYEANDMVKADCKKCLGCSACCQGMGTSILLDPLDIHRLTTGLKCTFEGLLMNYVELNVVDGIILPNLKMTGENESCSFLNEAGRCTIHSIRPGFCRIFPLGRLYENRSFKYFLQVKECPKENKTKVKVRKWIDTPEWKKNEDYISDWHYFLKDMESLIKEKQDESFARESNLYILESFFLKPYSMERDFYIQLRERLIEAKDRYGLAGLAG